MILASGKRLTKGDWLPKNKTNGWSNISTLDENERQHILKVLQATNWQVGGEYGAAKILDMKKTTRQSRMKKLGITRPINDEISAVRRYFVTDLILPLFNKSKIKFKSRIKTNTYSKK